MKRNRFDLSYPVQTTLNAGYLIPFYLQDTLPNDTFFISQKSFIRANPMTAPLLHDVDVFLQYWYCPERILWKDTEAFFLGLNEAEGLASPVRPYIVAPEAGFENSSLADYFGFPTEQGGIKVSALPFRAYAKIWNEKYRHQMYSDMKSVSYESGLDTETSTDLLSPRWKSDYFMRAEQSPQYGSQVVVPIEPPIDSGASTFNQYTIEFRYNNNNGFLGTSFNYTTSSSPTCPTGVSSAVLKTWLDTSSNLQSLIAAEGQWFKVVTGLNYGGSYSNVDIECRVSSVVQKEHSKETLGSFASYPVYQCAVQQAGLSNKNIATALSGSTIYNSALLASTGSLSLTSLAQGISMQRYQERMLKVEEDYAKFIKSNFGFKIRSDIIDEPQYLGGSRGQIVFSEVLQTSEGEQGGVGTMYGHGVGRTKQRPIKFRCPEHGLIVGLMSIRPRFVYSQGIERAWTRESRFDFFLPDFTDIGMQEIMQKELYATSSNADIPFGFTPRYEEYRSRYPKISGMFRKEYADWNMALKFTSPPSLNSSFLEMSSGIQGFKRPFAVPDEDNYLAYIYNRVTAIRCVPKFASRTKLS